MVTVEYMADDSKLTLNGNTDYAISKSVLRYGFNEDKWVISSYGCYAVIIDDNIDKSMYSSHDNDSVLLKDDYGNILIESVNTLGVKYVKQ